MYEMGPEARKALGQKARDYVLSEFTLQKTIDDWHDSLNETLTRFHSGKPRWTCETL